MTKSEKRDKNYVPPTRTNPSLTLPPLLPAFRISVTVH